MPGDARVEVGEELAERVPLGLALERHAAERVGRVGLEAELGQLDRQAALDVAGPAREPVEQRAEVGDVRHRDRVAVRGRASSGERFFVYGWCAIRRSRGSGRTCRTASQPGPRRLSHSNARRKRFGRTGERWPLLARAERRGLAEEDRVAAVAGAVERGAAAQVQLAGHDRRDCILPFSHCGASQPAWLGSLTQRPDRHARDDLRGRRSRRGSGPSSGGRRASTNFANSPGFGFHAFLTTVRRPRGALRVRPRRRRAA